MTFKYNRTEDYIFSFEIAIHIIVWWTIGIKKLKKAEETYL